MSKRLGFVSVLKETLSSCLSSKRKARKMTKEKAEAIKTMKSSGLTTMDSYNYVHGY